jgi:anti-anti-sigma factor
MVQESIRAEVHADETGISVVTVVGHIITNLSMTRVADTMEDVIRTELTPRVILDLSQVTYLDSFCFGWLISVFKNVQSRNGHFVLCSPNEQIVYLFGLTGFGRAMPIYSTRTIAKEAILSGDDTHRLLYFRS